ncbi:MAG: Smr/MutS family protein [Bacteroidetes bacterium]|nr:Smr/MutS family protein [Bacteroidota bacterium]
MDFKIGDKISFLNEKGNGVITNILTNYQVLVMNSDGFEISYPVNELVLLSNKSEYKMDSKMNPKWKDEKEEDEIKPPAHLAIDEAWEIDLHLHDVMDSFQQKGDHEKLTFQLNYFRKCMNAAIMHRMKKITFIHGVGKGTLKQEIIHALKDYDRIRHYDAPFRKYGYGAITVDFF